jgi:hypothetical protein
MLFPFMSHRLNVVNPLNATNFGSGFLIACGHTRHLSRLAVITPGAAALKFNL